MKIISSEQRRHFRIKFKVPLQGKAIIVSIDSKEVSLNKNMAVSILDMSAGGMRFSTALKVPPQKVVFAFSFKLEGESFTVFGQPLWIKEKGDLQEYGIKFVKVSPQEEERLIRCLNQYQLKKARAKSVQSDFLKEKTIEALARVIEVLPYPAWLITMDHVILAANGLAEEIRTIFPGQKCYLTIARQSQVCAHCKLSQVLDSFEIISGKIVVNKRDYHNFWINLEDGLFLYYFKDEP